MPQPLAGDNGNCIELESPQRGVKIRKVYHFETTEHNKDQMTRRSLFMFGEEFVLRSRQC